MNCSLQPWQPAALGTNSPSVPSSRASFHKLHSVVISNYYNKQLDSLALIVCQYPAFTCQAFRSPPISGIMNPEWYVQVPIQSLVPQRHQKRLLTTLPVSQSLEHFPSHRDDYILGDGMEILAAVSLTSFLDTTTSSSSSLSETPASESPAYCFDSRMTPIPSPTFPQ
jgi:hypothetical protein